MSRLSSMGVIKKTEDIESFINDHVLSMEHERSESRSHYPYERIKEQRGCLPTIKHVILYDTSAIHPDSFIEYIFMRTFVDICLPEHIHVYIAYESGSMSRDVKRISSAIQTFKRNYGVETFYLHSSLFENQRSLRFVPNLLFKLATRLSTGQLCPNEYYRAKKVDVYEKVI